jgi:Fe-Mn family superoxide dismutase
MDLQRPDRRTFLKLGAGAAALAGCGGALGSAASEVKPEALPDFLTLPPLPWAPDALAPTLGQEAVELHHGRHHAGYVKNLARLLADPATGAPQAESLAQLVQATAGRPGLEGVYRNAAQHWNHTFLWDSLTPQSAGPSATLTALLDRDLGGREACVEALVKAGLGQFGSGWAWLAVRDGRLEILTTPDADSPLVLGARPLLTLDVWEHAYYVDWRNDRAGYLKALTSRHLSWENASRLLASA